MRAASTPTGVKPIGRLILGHKKGDVFNDGIVMSDWLWNGSDIWIGSRDNGSLVLWLEQKPEKKR